MEMIEDNSNLPWDYYWIGQNPNLTMKMLRTTLEISCDKFELSQNPNITMEMVNKNPNIEWDWSGICYNKNLTLKMINDNIEEDWQLQFITLETDIENKKNKMLQMFQYVSLYEEELILTVLHPMRVQRYIQQYGYNIGTDEACIFNL